MSHGKIRAPREYNRYMDEYLDKGSSPYSENLGNSGTTVVAVQDLLPMAMPLAFFETINQTK